jgi:hypothetical protein
MNGEGVFNPPAALLSPRARANVVAGRSISLAAKIDHLSPMDTPSPLGEGDGG